MEGRNEQFVHNVELVYKYPVYGYSRETAPFLKVTLYDPKHLKKCSDLLYNGVIFSTPMQPYEAHITYFMHFYGDYNVSGMDFIKVADFKLRHCSAVHPERL